jgi:hypothetical protein
MCRYRSDGTAEIPGAGGETREAAEYAQRQLVSLGRHFRPLDAVLAQFLNKPTKGNDPARRATLQSFYVAGNLQADDFKSCRRKRINFLYELLK